MEYKLGTKHEDKHLFTCSGACGFDDLKIIINGLFSISIIKNDFEYNNEVQLQVWSDSVKLEPRKNQQNWNRIEFFLKPKDLDVLISELVLIREDLKKCA